VIADLVVRRLGYHVLQRQLGLPYRGEHFIPIRSFILGLVDQRVQSNITPRIDTKIRTEVWYRVNDQVENHVEAITKAKLRREM
jgi:hypothetical protein